MGSGWEERFLKDDSVAFPETVFSVPLCKNIYCCSHIIMMVKDKEMSSCTSAERDLIQGILSF